MKIGPRYVPKKFMINRLERRNNQRVRDFVTISEELAPEQRTLLSNIASSLSRYAARKGAHLEFVPATHVSQNPLLMNVYKKGMNLFLDANNPHANFIAESQDLAGKTILPNNIKDASDLVGIIRKFVKSVVSNDKNWDRKILGIHNLPHGVV